MSAFLLSIANTGGKTLKNNANAVVVFASTSAIAKKMAAAHFDGVGDVFDSADVTATELIAATDWNGWTVKVIVGGGLGAGTDGATFTVLADGTTNTMDEIAAALVTLINAHADIAGAEYDAATNTLTVAAIGDGIGDQQLTVEMIPPGAYENVPGLHGAIVDGGIAGAVLTVVLPLDAAVIPSVPVACRV